VSDRARVLLLSPPFVPEYMRNARCDFVSLSASQWYPILLGWCGAYIEGLGHEVRLIDAPAAGMDHEATRDAVRRFRPDLLVVYTGRLSELNDVGIADAIVEELKCDAVLVGPYVAIDPEGALRSARAVDKAVAGEFEPAVAGLLAGTPVADVPGLVRREGDGFVRNAARAPLTGAELDAIPFVSGFLGRQLDLGWYRTPSELYPYMDVMTGRGCAWGRCTYCLWVHTWVKGPTYNVRSIDNVVEEFRCIARDLPRVRSVMIQDDTFTGERAHEFSEALLRSGTRIPWSCYARADLRPEALAAMKRAGCRNLHVGYESGDPEVLRRIHKGLTVERMTRFTADAKRAGLRIHGDFAIGFPGETVESARATIRWARALDPETAQFQLMIPFPGTRYHDEMRDAGWLNAAGEPDMPAFTNEQIRAVAKEAYRSFYLTPRYAWRCVTHPREHLLGRMKTFRRAIAAMFWKRW